MAGRPRTMLKRVSRILERQEGFANELRELMPKQYVPGPGEGWDYPKNLKAWGDDLMRSWRKAVIEIGWVSEYLEDLVSLLELKVEKVEQNASRDTLDTADDQGDDADQPESLAQREVGGTPDFGDAPSCESHLAEQNALQGAAS